MAGNTNPLFALTGFQGWSNVDGDGGAAGPLKTANASLDGTGTLLTLGTAPTDGWWVEDIICAPAGTNVQTVLRVWLCDDAGTAIGDAVKIAEQTLPATTASATSAMPHVRVPIRMMVPATYRIRVAIGTTVAAGYFLCANGLRYS